MVEDDRNYRQHIATCPYSTTPTTTGWNQPLFTPDCLECGICIPHQCPPHRLPLKSNASLQDPHILHSISRGGAALKEGGKAGSHLGPHVVDEGFELEMTEVQIYAAIDEILST